MKKERNKSDLILATLEYVINEIAWHEVLDNFMWTEELLEKYKDKVDWKEISSNSHINWTSSMLEKFKSLIDWDEFSYLHADNLYTKENLALYQDFWNWSHLSYVISDIELIDIFIDKWDWKEIIYNYSLKDHFNKEFLIKYIDYIPFRPLENSALWNAIIGQEKQKLIQEINS